jgi:uncharacterized CHY-type Zn-finger protein
MTSPKFSKIGLYPIYHLNFSSQYELAMTFLRFQEYYESPNPKFRGHTFTFEEYVDWYIKTYNGFTYYKDWGGFNVPSYAIDAVRSFSCLSKREDFLINLVDGKIKDKQYYLIGTFGKTNLLTLKHEVCHGMFYCCPEYKKIVSKIVKRYRVSNLYKVLLNIGYCKKVLVDEVQAYAITGYLPMPKTKEMLRLSKELKINIRAFDIFKGIK